MEEEAYIFGYHNDIDPYHKVTLMSTELDNSNDDKLYNVLKRTRPWHSFYIYHLLAVTSMATSISL